MNWLLKLIFVAIGEILQGIAEVLGTFINNIFDVMYELNADLKLDELSNYIVLLAIGLVIVFSLIQIINVYVFQTEGDIEDDPLELITRVFMTIATILCGNTMVQYLLKIASTLCKELVSFVQQDDTTLSDKIVNLVTSYLTMNTITVFIQMIFLCITIVGLVIFIYKASKRGAELIAFQLLLPLIALNMLTKSQERWNNFRNALLICIFGYALQIITYSIFMILFSNVFNNASIVSNFKYILASMSWLFFTLSAPKWLEQFMYTTGIGQASKQSISSLAHLIPKMIRKA